MVLVRQRPGEGTAIFITLSDETGVCNVVVWARIFDALPQGGDGRAPALAEGKVQKSPEGVVHLMAERLIDRSADLRLLSGAGAAGSTSLSIAIPEMCAFCRRRAIFTETGRHGPLSRGLLAALRFPVDLPMIAAHTKWDAEQPMAVGARLGRHGTGRSSTLTVTCWRRLLVMAVPLWSVWAPAMPDYPAHLASFALIEQGSFHHGVPGARRLSITCTGAFVPNLASEVLVPLLAQLTGLVAATKLFLTAAIFLWVLGPGAVHRALYGRAGIAPLFGAFFAYNANFTWGFFNYYFAAGLSFAIFAAWIATENRNSAGRVPASRWRSPLLYFCHIFAAASLLLMLVGFEAGPNICAGQCTIWPPGCGAPRACAGSMSAGGPRLSVSQAPTSAGGSDCRIQPARHHAGPLRKPDRSMPSTIAPMCFPRCCSAALALALALAQGAPASRHVGYAGVCCLIGALLAPEWALGGWAVHLRLPAVFGAMLFASTELPHEAAGARRPGGHRCWR